MGREEVRSPLKTPAGRLAYQWWYSPLKMATIVYKREIGVAVLESYGCAMNE